MSLPPAPWVIRHRLLLRTSFDASPRVCPGSNSARVCEISSGTQVKDPACARCTAGRTGVRNVLFHANARMLVPDHVVELVVFYTRSREHAPPGHAPPTWHTMGVKCMPPAWHTAPHSHFSFNQTLQHTCQDSCPRIPPLAGIGQQFFF